MDHLQKNTGLDTSAMTVEVTNVTYRGNEADATVAFKPKNSPDAGMSMPYTLENRNGHWVVKKRADGGTSAGANPHAGGGAAVPGATGTSQGDEKLPPGHPPTPGAAASGQAGQQLPAGHPPVGPAKTESDSNTKSGSNAAKK